MNTNNVIDLDKIDEFNKWLFEKREEFKDQCDVTFPYLKRPTEAYLNANMKCIVYNRETCPWGDTEEREGKIKTYKDVELIYTNMMDTWEWPCGSVKLSNVWHLYQKLRELSEGLNPDPFWNNKVGWLHSEIALIGKRNEKSGYDEKILDDLKKAFCEEITLLKPNIIFMGIGVYKKDNKIIIPKNYFQILESYFGKVKKNGVKQLQNDIDFYKIEFEKNNGIECYGFPHPATEYYKTFEMIKKVLEPKIRITAKSGQC